MVFLCFCKIFVILRAIFCMYGVFAFSIMWVMMVLKLIWVMFFGNGSLYLFFMWMMDFVVSFLLCFILCSMRSRRVFWRLSIFWIAFAVNIVVFLFKCFMLFEFCCCVCFIFVLCVSIDVLCIFCVVKFCVRCVERSALFRRWRSVFVFFLCLEILFFDLVVVLSFFFLDEFFKVCNFFFKFVILLLMCFICFRSVFLVIFKRCFVVLVFFIVFGLMEVVFGVVFIFVVVGVVCVCVVVVFYLLWLFVGVEAFLNCGVVVADVGDFVLVRKFLNDFMDFFFWFKFGVFCILFLFVIFFFCSEFGVFVFFVVVGVFVFVNVCF